MKQYRKALKTFSEQKRVAEKENIEVQEIFIETREKLNKELGNNE